MGWGFLDYVPGVSNVKGAIEGDWSQAAGGAGTAAVRYARNATNAPQQPGIATGPAKDPSQLRRDPTTGVFFDPTTGQSYTSADGQTPVADPNLAQQTALNFQRAGGFLGEVAAQDATLDAVNAGQGKLGASLQNTISNVNAPSVAATQLAQQTDNNAKQILGTAAGVGGNNAYDARRNAIMALSGANTAAAGNAALLRAKEVSDAQNNLGTVLSQQGQAAQARENTNIAAGTDFAKTSASSQASQQGLNQKTDEANQDKDTKYAGAGLKFLSGLGG